MDEAAKKTVLRMIPYGLYVLGAGQGDDLAMATVNWVTQTSFAPPLVVMGVKTDSGAHELMKRGRTFALSMLKSGQKDLAYAFFKPSSPEGGKINGFDFTPAANGCPTLNVRRATWRGKLSRSSSGATTRCSSARSPKPCCTRRRKRSP